MSLGSPTPDTNLAAAMGTSGATARTAATLRTAAGAPMQFDPKAFSTAMTLVKSFPKDNPDIRAYCSDLRAAQAVCNLSWPLLLNVIQARLTERPRTWFESHKGAIHSVDHLEEQLRKQFGQSISELANQFSTIHLQEGEDVRTYHERFLQTIYDLEMDQNNAIAVDAYINGLGELGLMATSCTTIEEAKDKATHTQCYQRRMLNRTTGTPAGPSNQGQSFLGNLAATFSTKPQPYQQAARTNYSGPKPSMDGSRPWEGNRQGNWNYPNQGQQWNGDSIRGGSNVPNNGSMRSGSAAGPAHKPPWQQPSQHPWNGGGRGGPNRDDYTARENARLATTFADDGPGGAGDVESLRRELEQLKVHNAQLRQRGPGGPGSGPNQQPTRSHMMHLIEEEEIQPDYKPITDIYVNQGPFSVMNMGAAAAQRPRNFDQLPTYADEPMMEAPRVRRAAPAGPTRADAMPAAAGTSDLSRKIMEGRKYIVSIKDILTVASRDFQEKVAKEFNSCCTVNQAPTPLINMATTTRRSALKPSSNMEPDRTVRFAEPARADPQGRDPPPSGNRPMQAHAASSRNRNQRESGMVEIEILVNSHPVRAYVDSGAEKCVMNRPVAARCGLLRDIATSGNVVCQGVSGPPIRADGIVTGMVELGRAKTQCDFVVINNPDASFNILLGVEWCQMWQLDILFSTNHLVLSLGGGEQLKIPFYRPSGGQEYHFVELLNDKEAQDMMDFYDNDSITSSQYSRMTDDAADRAGKEAEAPTPHHLNETALIPFGRKPTAAELRARIFRMMEDGPEADADAQESEDKEASEEIFIPYRTGLIIEDGSDAESDTHPISEDRESTCYARDEEEALRLKEYVEAFRDSCAPPAPPHIPSPLESEARLLADEAFLTFYQANKVDIWSDNSGSLKYFMDRWFDIRPPRMPEAGMDKDPDLLWFEDQAFIAADAEFEKEVEEFFEFRCNFALENQEAQRRTIQPFMEQIGIAIQLNQDDPLGPFVYTPMKRQEAAKAATEDTAMDEAATPASANPDIAALPDASIRDTPTSDNATPEEGKAHLIELHYMSACQETPSQDKHPEEDDDGAPMAISEEPPDSDKDWDFPWWWDEPEQSPPVPAHSSDSDISDEPPDLVYTSGSDTTETDNGDSDPDLSDSDEDSDDNSDDPESIFSFEYDHVMHGQEDLPGATLEYRRTMTMTGGNPDHGEYRTMQVPGYPNPVRVGCALATDREAEFSKLLTQHREAFCIDITDLSVPCSIIQCHLDTGTHPPIYSRPYRRSPVEDEALAALTRQLCDYGIVEPSISPWASPAMAIPKKVAEGKDEATMTIEEKWRHVVDYRKFNDILQADRYPMPVIQDCLERAASGTIYSRCDLKLSFYQCELDEESRQKTAFATIDGLWQYRRVPMGLKSAPAIFVRAVSIALASVINKSVVLYYDDILIVSPDPITHMKDVATVLSLLAKAHLRAAPDKCLWFVTQVKFTGHVLEKGLIRPDGDKIRAVLQYPPPIDIQTLMSFLGLVGYYQRHVVNFSNLAYPLRLLLRKDTPWQWRADIEHKAFEALKGAIASEPVIAAPDWNRVFLLQTDYSATALAAILSQRDEANEEHIIACASRACSSAESKLSATEGELTALVYGITHFHRYLFGRRFKAETDHSALAHLHRFKDQYSKLARYAILLQGYDFEVVYRRGRLNGNADALSRVAPIKDDEAEHELGTELIEFVPNPRTRVSGGGEGHEDRDLTGAHLIKVFMNFEPRPKRGRDDRQDPPIPESPRRGHQQRSLFHTGNEQETPSPDLLFRPGRFTQEAIERRALYEAEHESRFGGPILPRRSLFGGTAGEGTLAGPSGGGAGPSGLFAPSVPSGGGETRRTKPTSVTEQSSGSSYASLDSDDSNPSDSSDDLPEIETPANTSKENMPPPAPRDPGRAKTPRKDIWADPVALKLIQTGEYEGDLAQLKALKKKVANYEWRDGKILFAGRIVPPTAQRLGILTDAHNKLGHRGSRSIRDLLVKGGYTWARMKEMAEQLCRECQQCEQKGLKAIVDPVLQPLPLPDFFARGVMDLFGPYPPSRYGNTMVAVYQDYHSKWVIARGIPNKTPIQIRKFLRENVIFGISPPIEIICDNGGEFAAETKKECEAHGIKITHGAAYHPNTQGLVERTNRTLQEGLRSCMTGQQQDMWEDYLPECVAGMNFSKQRTTGFSPFQVLFCISPRLPIQIHTVPDAPEEEISEEDKRHMIAGMQQRSQTLNDRHMELVENVDKAQERQKKEYAKRRETKTSLPAIGSLVWVRKQRRGDGTAGPAKAAKKDISKGSWYGPLKLVGYAASGARAIVESPATAQHEATRWHEAWKDVATKEQMSRKQSARQDQRTAEDEEESDEP